MAFQQGDAAVDQQGAINAVQPLNFAVLVTNQGGPVEARLPQLPAKAFSLVERLGEMGAIHQQLFRYTAHVHAGAAQVTAFRHGHFGTKTGGESCSAYAAGTGADDKKVKIVIHQYSPACPWLRG